MFGLGNVDPVVLSDEPGELTFLGGGMVFGRHQWFNNADGGVVAFDCPAAVTVGIANLVNINEWVYVEADGTTTALDMTARLEIECNDEPANCNTSCAVPACGDGFLDPGEECDDGNLTDGDGCPADCDLPQGPVAQ
ncbi:MAG: DUF4215 domain-containing protein [Deltaproteobacteria bacterium]|nr:DUF4215 domain-containing protein [Deltaproteobacteria bacterium]